LFEHSSDFGGIDIPWASGWCIGVHGILRLPGDGDGGWEDGGNDPKKNMGIQAKIRGTWD